jgi:Flp pilus assembly protein TadD
MRSRSRPTHHPEGESRVVTLLRRARRARLRGEARQAMLAVREACFACRTDARLWALYGAACRRARRHDEAKDAIRQAIWLRERERDSRRAGSLQRLLLTLD